MSTGIAAPLRIEPDVVPDAVKDARIHVLPVAATAEQAAQLMAQAGARALVVLEEDGRFAGIVTEQDLVREVLAKGRNASAVNLATLVNRHQECLAPSDLALDALDLMRIRNVSHLPVIAAGRVIAVVSIGDICAAVRRTLDVQLRQHEAAVFGDLLQE